MQFPYDRWNIPEQCLLDKRIYKKLFHENTKLTATDKKWFTTDIDSLIWQYTIKPELTLISEFQQENYAYNEIAVLDVDVNDFNHSERLADIIQRTIPHPLLIVFRYEERIALSIADKRYNLNDPQAATLQDLWTTEFILPDSLSDVQEQFLNQLDYQKQPKLHLKAFYQRWIDAFIAYESAKITGRYEIDKSLREEETRRSTLQQYHEIEGQVNDLKSRIKKEQSFSKQVELNQEIKQLQSQLTEIAEQL
ncbi:MAG: DUF4391 family protein [Candidatus Lokiarchaeota archaeon]|nr:DUF4391 family protein [Candidatus Lokiarchaeota archaeon]